MFEFEDEQEDDVEEYDADERTDESTCASCRKRIFSLISFCGFCGFRNNTFDNADFIAKTKISIEHARNIYCTPHWHGQLVSDRKHAPKHVREEAMLLRYCSRCGEELIPNQKAKDLQVDYLISEIFS